MTRNIKPPVTLYSALADATRCRIIEILRDGSVPVHQLADAFSISRPAISRHLRVLKEAGLVAELKKGRENHYALRAERLGKGTVWIESIAAKKAAPPRPEPARPTPSEKPVRPEQPKGINQMGFDF
jgi:DNA-binding transcriptional ArsR family regulator